MKKNLLNFMAIFLFIILTGCGKPKDPSVMLAVDIPYRVYDIPGLICEDFYVTYVKDSSSDRNLSNYYWLGLKNETEDKWVFLSDSGKQGDGNSNYIDLLLGSFIKTGYHINVHEYYSAYVYRCNAPDKIGDTNSYNLYGKSLEFKFSDLTAWGPDDSCDIKCCTEGLNYSQFVHFVDNASSIETRISTQYGHLCGWLPPPAEGSDEMSSSFAYCSIGKEVLGETKWGQVGYTLTRPRDRIYVYPSYYCEVNDEYGVNQWFAYLDPALINDSPLVNEDHVYLCSLNTSCGEWCFRVDGDSLKPGFIPSVIWDDGGTKITLSGEVSHVENDMPGDANNPMVFSDMRYMLKNDNYSKKMVYNSQIDHWGSDNENEWGFSWDTITTTKYVDSIYVWDKYPLPW
ncbi:MAG: hypothetical protein R3F48_17440 [Candidatus Zixiibacteriota bacterium]